MEPPIEFFKSKDGLSLACTAIGEGEPLIFLWNPIANIQQQWDIPECRRWYEKLAEARLLIQLDYRGTGLSEREITSLSIEDLEDDITALADHLGLERFSLFGNATMGGVAISYAAHHPERVKKLILFHAFTSSSDYRSTPQVAALGSMTQDWELYTNALARFGLGWSGGDAAKRFAATIREGISHETFLTYQAALMRGDVSDLLTEVRAPTLVLHRRDFGLIGIDSPKRLASSIPRAQLMLLEGESGGYALEDSQSVLDAIGVFLGDALASTEGEQVEAKASLPEGTAVILFADIADSTGLTERLGDAAFREKARQLDGSLRTIIRGAEGTPVEGKLLGDGVLATFSSARRAIEAALRCRKAGDDGGLPLHLGLHAGDVIREENNVYGGAVNIAARIAAASAPGEVLLSQTVRDLARTSAVVAFDDRGEHKLKGIDEPQRLFGVRGQADG